MSASRPPRSDVERVEDRLHAAVGAPQRDQDADHRGEPERAAALLREPLHLPTDDVDGPVRQDSAQVGEVRVDRARVRDRAVDGDQRGDGREQGEDGVEGHARRHEQQAVLVELPVEAQRDVLPALGRDLGRGIGLMAAVRLALGELLGRRAFMGHGFIFCSRACAGLVWWTRHIFRPRAAPR